MIASGMVRDLAANLAHTGHGITCICTACIVAANPLLEKLLLKEEDEEDRCEDCLRHLSFCRCGEYEEEEP